MKQPIQPIEKDINGHFRFKENAIVQYLLDRGPFDMNHLAAQGFSNEDSEQFAQLIGYSLNGFGELSYVSDETYDTAHRMAYEGESEAEARSKSQEETLSAIREGIRDAAVAAFKIHPDNLQP